MEEKNQAMMFAMKLIGLRRRSVFEIEKRLSRKGYSERTIEEVLIELKKFKYLDDEIFAESFISDRINLKPCGKRLLEKDLKEKGVPSEIVRRKLELMIDDNLEIELAGRLVSKKMRLMKNDGDRNRAKRKLISHLASKGFSFDVIGQALKNKLE